MKEQSRRAGAALISIALAIGCSSSTAMVDASAGRDGGDGGAPEPNVLVPSDGTRLKARWMVGPEGQRAFAGYYDTMLSTICAFRRAADGELRCLPSGFLLESPIVTFADDACTVPAASYNGGDCNPDAFIRRKDTTNPCQTREHIYARGDRLAGNRTFSKSGSPPSCRPETGLDTEVAFRVGAELPVAMFVKATDVPQPAGSAALQLVERHSDDGAVSSGGWQNRATGTRCELWELDDHVDHCFPATARLSETTFSEGTCVQNAAFFTGSCAMPTVALQTSSSCPITFHPVALGPAMSTVYRVSDGMCTAQPAASGLEYRSLDMDVPADPYPPLQTQIEQQPWRLERRVQAAPDGSGAQLFGFHDRTRNELCVPYNFGGKYRCGPDDTVEFHYLYADAQCTRPLLALDSNSCASPYALGWDFKTCPPAPQVYSVHAVVRPAATYTLYGVRGATEGHVECRPTSPAPGPQTDFLELTAVPETEFAEVTVIEPK
jgi:hypothetical protein